MILGRSKIVVVYRDGATSRALPATCDKLARGSRYRQHSLLINCELEQEAASKRRDGFGLGLAESERWEGEMLEIAAEELYN
jgi:hypothetical protein